MNQWGRTRLITIDSRYIHHIAISNARTVGIDNESVAFRYTDYADGRRVNGIGDRPLFTEKRMKDKNSYPPNELGRLLEFVEGGRRVKCT